MKHYVWYLPNRMHFVVNTIQLHRYEGRLCLMCATERYLSISLPKKRLRNPDSQLDRHADNQQQSGRWGRQTGHGVSRDVDEYITGSDIALLRHKVLERRPGQLCSEAENYSNLKSSSFGAILIVFPLLKNPKYPKPTSVTGVHFRFLC